MNRVRRRRRHGVDSPCETSRRRGRDVDSPLNRVRRRRGRDVEVPWRRVDAAAPTVRTAGEQIESLKENLGDDVWGAIAGATGMDKRPSSLSKDGAKKSSHRRTKPFLIDPTTVSNDQFKKFVRATGHKTEAEAFQWSFVLEILASNATSRGGNRMPSRCTVSGADRGDAAGRDVEVPRATERTERTKIDGRRRSREEQLTGCVGPKQACGRFPHRRRSTRPTPRPASAASRRARGGSASTARRGASPRALTVPSGAKATTPQSTSRGTTRRRTFRRTGIPPTNRGGAAAATWIFRGDESLCTWIFRGAELRPRRGSSAETSRGGAAAATWLFRGDESLCTWIFHGDESRRRRGCDVHLPRSRGRWTFRGSDSGS